MPLRHILRTEKVGEEGQSEEKKEGAGEGRRGEEEKGGERRKGWLDGSIVR